MVDKIISANGNGKPIWMGLQGFYISPEGYVGQITFDQARFMTYDAIVHGATGLFWWDYKLKTSDTVSPDDIWTSLVRMATELSGSQVSAAVLGTSRQVNTVGSLRTLTTTDTTGSRSIIAVYESASPGNSIVIAGFSPDTNLAVLGENRSLKSDATGKIVDNFNGWGVHLYREQKIFDIVGLRSLLSQFTNIFDYNNLIQNFGK